MLADAWVSLGVVACGVGILFTGWTALDPLITLVIVIGYCQRRVAHLSRIFRCVIRVYTTQCQRHQNQRVDRADLMESRMFMIFIFGL